MVILALSGTERITPHDTASCRTCQPQPVQQQDYERVLTVCVDCLDAIEFSDDEIGAAPGTLAAHRDVILRRNPDLTPVYNGQGRIFASMYRSSDGTYESIPYEIFSTRPCEGCGSTLAGERHYYSVFIEAKYL